MPPVGSLALQEPPRMPQSLRRDPGRGSLGQLAGHCQAEGVASPTLRLLRGSQGSTERAGS